MKLSSAFSGKSLIKILLIALRSFFLLGSISMILWLLYTTVCLFTDTPMMSPRFQVMFTMVKDSTLAEKRMTPQSEFHMPVGVGMVEAIDQPKGFVALFSILSILSSICLLLAIRWTIQVLEAAGTGAFFLIANARRLRWIALFGFGMLFFYRLANFTSASHFKDLLQLPGVEFTNNYIFHFGDVLYVFSLLFLLVLAEAFRVGAIVKAENDLTI